MNPLAILVTGANGQLGRSLQEIAPAHSERFRWIFTDVDKLDITDKDALRRFIEIHDVAAIVNAAAYTAVDKAESDPDTAFLLNATAVGNLATLARTYHAYFVQISTDYVFDGTATTPYPIDATPNPLSVYGKSKLAGEQALRQAACRGALIRTAWLYSPYGNNFVKTMLRLANSRDQISVVNDQFGCPTLAADLARFIITLLETQIENKGLEIYHFANQGVVSWYDFAVEILRLAGSPCRVLPIPTSAYPTAATRPQYSVFQLDKTLQLFPIPAWNESLARIFPQILQAYQTTNH